MNGIAFINDNRQDIAIAWTVAVLIHVLFFFLTERIFIEPPQFAIVASHEIDINLIDAPKEKIQVEQQSKPVIKNLVPEKMNFKIAKSIVKTIEEPKQGIASKQIAAASAQIKVEAKPDYIQNPPPSYPPLAKQMREEGIVILSVDVNMQGDPVNVEIVQSSGFHLLDQAALIAVKHWKFQPGRVGGIFVDSKVEVPIRFRLEQ